MTIHGLSRIQSHLLPTSQGKAGMGLQCSFHFLPNETLYSGRRDHWTTIQYKQFPTSSWWLETSWYYNWSLGNSDHFTCRKCPLYMMDCISIIMGWCPSSLLPNPISSDSTHKISKYFSTQSWHPYLLLSWFLIQCQKSQTYTHLVE